ncbi:MAG TPA: hypothetical protein VGB18_03865 [Candidatus Thermoplasmatota archaeon]
MVGIATRIRKLQVGLLLVTLVAAAASHVLPWWEISAEGENIESETFHAYPYDSRDFAKDGFDELETQTLVTGILLTAAAIGALVASAVFAFGLIRHDLAAWTRWSALSATIVAGGAALWYTAVVWPPVEDQRLSFIDHEVYTFPFRFTIDALPGVGWIVAAIALVAIPLVLVATMIAEQRKSVQPIVRRKRAVLVERA